MRRLLPLALMLSACTHTEPSPTGADSRLAPIEPSTTRLTFGGGTLAQWTPDGSGILYLFNTVDTLWTQFGVTDTLVRQCLGIVPRLGGTRSWSSCDTRATHADSIDHFSSPALDASGRLLFVQAVYRRPQQFAPVGTPQSVALWMADSANPLGTRTKLLQLPVVLGDSVISWLDNPRWIDASTFIVAGSRYNSGDNGNPYPEPRQLLRGTLTATGATFEPITGTMGAIWWTRAPSGDLLFLRGNWWTLYNPTPPAIRVMMNDSIVWRMPLTGGTPVPAAVAPRRLQMLNCSGNDCLAPDMELVCSNNNPATCVSDPVARTVVCSITCAVRSTQLSWFDATTLQRKTVPLSPGSFSEGAQLSPSGAEYFYRGGNNLWHLPFSRP